MAEITKVAFQLGSSAASKHLTDAEYIQGGYFVVDTYTNLITNYSVATAETDGTIIEGSLCYCVADDKFYQYKTTGWEEAKMGANEDMLAPLYEALEAIKGT